MVLMSPRGATTQAGVWDLGAGTPVLVYCVSRLEWLTLFVLIVKVICSRYGTQTVHIRQRNDN